MPFNATSEQGHANWRSLSLQQQYRATAWVTEWLLRNNQLSSISPDVVGIGAGSRERRHGRGKRYWQRQPVLTVHVREKKSLQDCGDCAVPPYIQLSVPVGGRRLMLAIPTDVRVERDVPKAQADPSKVLARSGDGSPSVDGSICALVKNTSGNTELRYALTCHHVAFLSLLSANFSADTSAEDFHQQGSTVTTRMGKSSRGTRLVPAPIFSLDAALVRLDTDSPAREKDFWSAIPTNWVKDSGELAAAFGHDAQVFNRRSQGQAATFSTLRSDFQVRYTGGGTARFSQLIEYILPAGRSTAEGDSGGALIAARFNLIGMHIAGSGRIGYAIPAYQLLRTTAFAPSITLAMPL